MISKGITARTGLFKMILTLAAIHLIGTYGSQMLIKRQVLMSITDYLMNQNIKDNSTFQIFGIVKVNSITFQRGHIDTIFKITDFKNEITVQYNGQNKFEFKEGETIVLTAYVPNPKIKQKIIAIDYQTKHSMEIQNWQDKINDSRQNFGLLNEQKKNAFQQ